MPDGSIALDRLSNRRPAEPDRRPRAELPTRPGEVVYGKLRLVKQGPWVPARCWVVDGDRCPDTGDLLSDQRLAFQVMDDPARWAPEWWPRGWPWRPIAPAEWTYLTELRAWALAHDPTHPLANPTRPLVVAEASTW
jgi:hypothetical protein